MPLYNLKFKQYINFIEQSSDLNTALVENEEDKYGNVRTISGSPNQLRPMSNSLVATNIESKLNAYMVLWVVFGVYTT